MEDDFFPARMTIFKNKKKRKNGFFLAPKIGSVLTLFWRKKPVFFSFFEHFLVTIFPRGLLDLGGVPI